MRLYGFEVGYIGAAQCPTEDLLHPGRKKNESLLCLKRYGSTFVRLCSV